MKWIIVAALTALVSYIDQILLGVYFIAPLLSGVIALSIILTIDKVQRTNAKRHCFTYSCNVIPLTLFWFGASGISFACMILMSLAFLALLFFPAVLGLGFSKSIQRITFGH